MNTVALPTVEIIEQQLNSLSLDYSDCYYLLTADQPEQVVAYFRGKALQVEVVASFDADQDLGYLSEYCENKNIPQIDFYPGNDDGLSFSSRMHIFCLRS